MADRAEDLPEAAVDPSTSDLLGWIWKLVYNIAYPIVVGLYWLFYYISFAVVLVLKLLYEPLAFVLLPVVYLVQFLWSCFLAPFRFAARFETLYIYLGIAALVGITGGLIVSFIYGSLQGPLGLNSDANGEPKHAGRTVKQYREDRRKKKAKNDPLSLSSGYSSPNNLSLSEGMSGVNVNGKGKGKRKGLLQQTIMEEMDSDDY